MKHIFIFDIDGVITQPTTKKPNNSILSFIAHQLQRKEPVAIATGRGLAWVKRKIISRVTKLLSSDKLLDYLFISGEKGGVWMEFFDGKPREYTDLTVAVPTPIIQRVKEKVTTLSGIFFESEKKTMISVEIQGGENTEKIRKEKETLHEFELWVKKDILPLSSEIMIDPTVISVDVQNKNVNKRIAAQQFLTFLGERGIASHSFIMFGDSPNDAQVPEELQAHGKAVTFMYVGKISLDKKYNFPILTTKTTMYDDAVLELLARYETK